MQIPGGVQQSGGGPRPPLRGAGGPAAVGSAGGAVWTHSPHRASERPASEPAECFHHAEPGEGTATLVPSH